MRQFWAWAVATDRLDHNVAASIPRVKPGKPNPRPCPDAAYKRALLAAGQRERLMLRLSAELGLRRAEVAVIHARDVVDDLGGSSLIVHGKGGKLRTVPLPTGLGVELSQRAEQGGWEIDRVRVSHDGTRRVVLRRKIIRQRPTYATV